jgi:type I restriction-modification system DNA methylase subunit
MARYEGAYAAFLKEIRSVALYKHRYDVFRDFVTMAAISIRNAIRKDEEREAEYMKLIGSYEKKDQQAFPKLLALLVEALEFGPRDVLGTAFMDLELGSRDKGQFFTPFTVSEMMAEILHGDELSSIEKPFITLSEPACGAGGMVLAFVKVMLKQGHDPASRLWVQCVDVDRLAALMCYVQLSLWNVPAEVIVGNSLSLEVREIWHTPQHFLGFWTARLRARDVQETTEKPVERIPEMEGATASPAIEQVATNPPTSIQFDFGF